MIRSVFVKPVKYREESKKPTEVVLGSMCFCRSTNECVIGGGLADCTTVQGSLGEMIPSTNLWVYKIDTGIWNKNESFALPKELMGCSLVCGNICCMGQKLFVFGGIDRQKNPQNELHIYDFKTKEWETPKVYEDPESGRHYIRPLMFFADKDFGVVKVEDSPQIRYLGIFGMGITFQYLFYYDIFEGKFLLVELEDDIGGEKSVFGGLEVALAGQCVYSIIKEELYLRETNLKLTRLNMKTRKWEELEDCAPPHGIADYKYFELLSYQDRYLLGWGYAGVDVFPTAEKEEERLGDRKSNRLFVYDIKKGLWSTYRILCPEDEEIVVRRYLVSTAIVNDLLFVYGGSYCGSVESSKDQLEFRDMFYIDLRDVFVEEIGIEDEKERKEYLIEYARNDLLEEKSGNDLLKMIKVLSKGDVIKVPKIFLDLIKNE